MRASYRGLLQTRRFAAYALTAAGAHAGFHIFTAGAPAVLIIGLAIPLQDYGYYASLPPIGFLVGSFLSNRLTRRLGVDNCIAIGSAVLIPAGFAMVALAALRFGSPYAIVGPMVLICCGSGLITPNAVAGSLGVKVGIVGAASGLASFIQIVGAAGDCRAFARRQWEPARVGHGHRLCRPLWGDGVRLAGSVWPGSRESRALSV